MNMSSYLLNVLWLRTISEVNPVVSKDCVNIVWSLTQSYSKKTSSKIPFSNPKHTTINKNKLKKK